MPAYAVLVCERCRRVFLRPVARLIHGSVGSRYCSRDCYLRAVAPDSTCEWEEVPEAEDVKVAREKELVRAILWRAHRDGDTEFLQSDIGQALLAWSTT